MADDTYKTIAAPTAEQLYKEKSSKFFGYAFPVESENDVKQVLEALKKEHPLARHCCYAWQLGVEKPRYRANDDGEPNNTAGQPIYGQIQSFNVTNVLVVVVRYFGGIKLGAGGLISAYRLSAQMALDEAEIVERTVNVIIRIRFGYEEMNRVMRVIKEKHLDLVSQKMEERCEIDISVRKSALETVFGILNSMHKLEVKIKD